MGWLQFLANKRVWEQPPEDLRTVVAKHINAAGVRERADIAAMNAKLQQDFASKGMGFNQAQPSSFRECMNKARFYLEWKRNFGDEAWALLERSSGRTA